MCDPVTIAAVVTVASTAFTIQQQREQGRFQRDVGEFNARQAENEAEATRAAATETENIQRQRTQELLSKQRAQLGAAGVELTSGSALQLQEDTLTLGEADALRIRSQGEQAFEALTLESSLTRTQGAFAKAAGDKAAVGSLLSGSADVLGTGVADKWFTSKSAARNPLNINQGGGIGL
jgi:hypothetical protein